jgi:acetyl-CoA C-acetyltransferase
VTRAAWIVDALRTPRGLGKAGVGALSGIHPQRLLSTVLRALQRRNALQSQDIDDVIIGCNYQVGRQAQSIARMAALDAGWLSVSGAALDRFCASGLTAVHLAAASVVAGYEDLVVAGGVEMMSYKLSQPPLLPLDAGNLHLRRLHPQFKVGLCADLIATQEGFSREELDALAVESQRRAARAIETGAFRNSLVPVHHDDGTLALDHEEYPRPGTTLEQLAALPPSFERSMTAPLSEGEETYGDLVGRFVPGVTIRHVHHAGNSSGIVDGAAAVLVASSEYARKQGLRPRARIVAAANSAGSPEYMLNEPGPATAKVLRKARMSLRDVDLIEVNEAFAVVPAKFMRDLNADPDKVNVNGGAIALGHPIGATGAMLLGTLLDELERRDRTVGLATMCAAGGMAPAMIVERIG